MSTKKKTAKQKAAQPKGRKKKTPTNPQKAPPVGGRLTIVMVLFCMGFSLLGYRAFVLQVKRSKQFRDMVKASQYTTIRLPAKRGDIFDRHMTPLAISVEVDSISANPRMIRDKLRVARSLSRILNVPRGKLLLLLAQDRYFVWIKRHVSRREVRAIQRLKLRGIRVLQESRRFYPNGHLASHLLGYTDRDGKGLAGVERFFDKLLRGKKQAIRLPRDPKGRRILRPGLLHVNGRWGSNVVLTIDKAIQYIAEREIEAAVRKWKAKRGIAVVMNPQNGDLLGLAMYPDFDPNRFRDYKTSVRNNAAISNPYEPGSTMKVISMAIARHLGLVRWSEKLDCEGGRMRIGRYTIHDDHPHKWLTPAGVIKYSSNICTAKIANRVGKKRLYTYMRKFGFGQRTNIGLPWETRGILHNYKRWANISLANIAFGQGVSVTPIQLTAAISAVANGGNYYQPRLYRSIVDRKGRKIREFPPHKKYRIISKKAAIDVMHMMELVVKKGGTGTNAHIKNIRVAGKTGTAQKPRANGRGYGRGRIGSFVGFLPAENPKLTILIVMDEPQGSKYGGTVAAPAFKRIALGSLRQLGYIPGGRVRFKAIQFPPPADAVKKEPKKAAQKVLANNKVKKAKDKKNQLVLAADHDAPKKTKQTPNFMRRSLREVMRRAQALGIRVNPIGRGVARYQKPRPGQALPKNRVVTVVFTSKRN